MGVHEAKTRLSELLRRVATGEEVTITRGGAAGEPLARLVPAQRQPERIFGRDRGLFEVPDDFNAPLPEEVLRTFE